jgi:hypothetical protein
MDDSFIAVKSIQANSESNPADFIANIAVSKGGQYFAPYSEKLIVEKEDYVISSVGTDYIYNRPDIENKLKDEQKKVLSKENPPRKYIALDKKVTSSSSPKITSNNDEDPI